MEKDWKANIEPWEMRADVRKMADFHAIGVARRPRHLLLSRRRVPAAARRLRRNTNQS